MRIGVVLDGRVVGTGGAALADRARRLEELGMDLVWLRADDALPDPLAAAPVVAAATRGLRIGVEVPLGAVHPVLVAEAAAVADLAVEGRLVLGLRPAAGLATTADGDFAAAVEIVLRAHRPRPFRVEHGPWPTPANLPENAFMRDRTIRVMPAPAQLELPTWVVGAPDVASALGLPAVLDDPAEGPGHWASRDAADPAAWRSSRPAVVDPAMDGGRVDAASLVADLQAAVSGWGMDTALFGLPAEDVDRALDDLARVVRPRVQQEQLPSGLLSWWDHELLGTPDAAIRAAGETP